MKTPAEIEAYVKSHAQQKPSRIAWSLHRHGVTTEQVKRILSGSERAAIQTIPPAMGRPVASLLDQFDDIKKVRTAMRQLPKDHFMEDDEMRRTLHITPERWRSVVQHPDLTAFRYALPNRKMVWMHPAAQAELNAAIQLDGGHA